jgi:branched-chain amino acid aminotransferase
MEPIALLNGRLVPQSQAALALNDAGFVFGATVTDLCRTFRRTLYRWPDHLARFRASCAAAYIDVPYADDQITAWANELVAENVRRAGSVSDRSLELILVLFATPGPIGYYLGQPGGAGDGPPTFGMHTFPLPFERYRALIEHGVALRISPIRHVPGECVDPRIKQRSRMHWWLASAIVRRNAPEAQALLLDASGQVTETASANLLVVRDGVVTSPPRESILGGISLGIVEELCNWLGIVMHYRAIAPQEVMIADEAMLSSTPYCLAGVRSIDGIHLGWPGPVLQRLLEAWSTNVGVDIHRQFTG